MKKSRTQHLEPTAGSKEKTVTILHVDRTKIFSRSVLPNIPDYYQDTWFTCKICGKRELWTAKQQKIWHEVQRGEIEAIAIHCNACRRKKRASRKATRKAHLEGLARKAALRKKNSTGESMVRMDLRTARR